MKIGSTCHQGITDSWLSERKQVTNEFISTGIEISVNSSVNPIAGFTTGTAEEVNHSWVSHAIPTAAIFYLGCFNLLMWVNRRRQYNENDSWAMKNTWRDSSQLRSGHLLCRRLLLLLLDMISARLHFKADYRFIYYAEPMLWIANF